MDFWDREACYESIRSFLFCQIFTVMILYIVNNGNILTDGRNERRHFERKYNKL